MQAAHVLVPVVDIHLRKRLRACTTPDTRSHAPLGPGGALSRAWPARRARTPRPPSWAPRSRAAAPTRHTRPAPSLRPTRLTAPAARARSRQQSPAARRRRRTRLRATAPRSGRRLRARARCSRRTAAVGRGRRPCRGRAGRGWRLRGAGRGIRRRAKTAWCTATRRVHIDLRAGGDVGAQRAVRARRLESCQRCACESGRSSRLQRHAAALQRGGRGQAVRQRQRAAEEPGCAEGVRGDVAPRAEGALVHPLGPRRGGHVLLLPLRGRLGTHGGSIDKESLAEELVWIQAACASGSSASAHCSRTPSLPYHGRPGPAPRGEW